MRNLHVLSTIVVVALLTVAQPAAADVPAIIPLQGYLLDSSGKPVDGDHRLTFFLYDAATDGDVLYTDNYNSVEVEDGYFVVYMGNQEDTPLDLELFREHRNVWVEVVIDGSETVSPRTYLASVPYAGVAQYCGDAETLGGKPPTDLVPAGALMPFAGTAAPAGWLLADGSAVSRTMYPNLFAAIGTTYGAGDGSTTFKLPDLRGRTAVGAGTGSGLTRRDLGATFGSESHALTAAQLAPHTHSGTSGEGNAMSYRTVQCSGTGTSANHIAGWAGCATYADYNDDSYALQDHTHNFTTDTGAGLTGAAHPTVKPSVALTYLIKY
jgi:microcystin-dependent protein